MNSLYHFFFVYIILAFLFSGCDSDDPVSVGDEEPDYETGTVTDIDGNEYQTVKIGDQWWMAENLRVSRYRNGDVIPNVTGNEEWSNLSSGAWANYNNNASHDETYGKLYNWYAVNDDRGLCPEGWRVPWHARWGTLSTYLGGYEIAGGKMKSTRTVPDPHPRWESPNTGATNESGWSGLPSGRRNNNGNFEFIGYYGYWWESTEVALDAMHRYLAYNVGAVQWHNVDKRNGYSIRCLRD